MRSGLLLLIFSASAFAQVYEFRNCVFHEGDDPAWARSDYDDRAWLSSPPDTRTSPYLWARCAVSIARPVNGPLYIQIEAPNAWILYVNGVRAGSYGNPETGRITMDMFREFVVPRDAGTGPELRIALRSTVSILGALTAAPLGVAGSKTDLELRRDRALIKRVSVLLPQFGFAIVQLGVAVMLLTLSLSGRTHRAAILLGILAMTTPLDDVPVLLSFAGLSVPLHFGLMASLFFRGFSALNPFFAYSILGRKTPRFYRYGVAVVLAFELWQIAVLFLPLSARVWLIRYGYTIQIVGSGLWEIYLSGLVTAFLPWRVLGRNQRWLLIPNALLFSAVSFWLYAFTVERRIYNASGSLYVTVVGLGFSLFYAIVIAFRFRRVNEEHQSFTDDMRSAREVQRRLVPEVQPIPGFRIEAAYVPAKEVGGDFYQFLPAEDGSLLVVVGDVSGKGLDAAMVVAAAVGALRGNPVREPKAVLACLNRALTGRGSGGFVTCCCALFRANGTVEIANAGHIPPYLDGREMEVEPGPPLGLIEEGSWPTTFVEAGSASLTFVSDGVLEATNARGELLGFDRLADLSVKPAREIAKEAERWGQEDDITVVQVAYA